MKTKLLRFWRNLRWRCVACGGQLRVLDSRRDFCPTCGMKYQVGP